MIGLIVLGNQLFDPGFVATKNIGHVFMREDVELCTYFKFHKLKIHFFLSAMRNYADELRKAKLKVTYQELKRSPRKYEEHLKVWLRENSITKLICFEIEDKFFESRIRAAVESAGIELEFLPSPMFLTSRAEFKKYLTGGKRPFMQKFYEQQRKRLKILVDNEGQPVGGQWSFDEQNRKPLPKTVQPPTLPALTNSNGTAAAEIAQKVTDIVQKNFADHPGETLNLWLPSDRAGAHKWLTDFVKKRLDNFGPYEDALSSSSDFVFHSALTPFLNTGLLTPRDVVKIVLQEAKKRKIEIASVEGFVRQVIGWREFIRGIYQNFSEVQDTKNFWDHQGKLSEHWYKATTGVPPLDEVIEKANRLGYAHHIERLMVVSNLMLLLEIEPKEAHRWFMEMFIDSSDWVMGPNVYGMGLFSDGGIFATKPYICGSNYYRKMGSYPKGEWCDAVDGLYWGFVEKNEKFFLKNPRMSMAVRTVQKMDPSRKKQIYAAAGLLRKRLTI